MWGRVEMRVEMRVEIRVAAYGALGLGNRARVAELAELLPIDGSRVGVGNIAWAA